MALLTPPAWPSPNAHCHACNICIVCSSPRHACNILLSSVCDMSVIMDSTLPLFKHTFNMDRKDKQKQKKKEKERRKEGGGLCAHAGTFSSMAGQTFCRCLSSYSHLHGGMRMGGMVGRDSSSLMPTCLLASPPYPRLLSCLLPSCLLFVLCGAFSQCPLSPLPALLLHAQLLSPPLFHLSTMPCCGLGLTHESGWHGWTWDGLVFLHGCMRPFLGQNLC